MKYIFMGKFPPVIGAPFLEGGCIYVFSGLGFYSCIKARIGSKWGGKIVRKASKLFWLLSMINYELGLFLKPSSKRKKKREKYGTEHKI